MYVSLMKVAIWEDMHGQSAAFVNEMLLFIYKQNYGEGEGNHLDIVRNVQ